MRKYYTHVTMFSLQHMKKIPEVNFLAIIGFIIFVVIIKAKAQRTDNLDLGAKEIV